MPETKCYAMVRGSSIRVTGLGPKGSIPKLIQYAVSKSVAKVTINEVTEGGSSETFGSDENDNDTRLRLRRSDQTIHYTVDIDFLRVDPGVLSLIVNAPLVHAPSVGFGEVSFGEDSFGGGQNTGSVVIGFDEAPFGDGPFGGVGVGGVEVIPTFGFGGDSFGDSFFGGDFDEENPIDEGGVEEAPLTVVGFDSVTRRPPASFALEVWSKLAGRCADGSRQYGYTVFPFLKGGRITGFEFKNGLVSFSIRGAQTRRGARWAVGPYDLEGVQQRLLEPVSRNTFFRQALTTAPPPAQMDGIQETVDVIEGGTATVTSSDVISGGTAISTTPWIISGGQAV